MAKKLASFRLDEALLGWAAEYATSRGASQGVVVEEALRHFQGLVAGGVRDLPVVDTPAVREQRAAEAPAESHAAIMGARQARLNKEMGW